MKKVALFLVCFLIVSCATKPKLTKQEKCKMADKKLDLAMSIEGTDDKLSLKYALESVLLCPSSSNCAYVAYLDAKRGWYKKAIQFADLALQGTPTDSKTLTYAAIAYGKAGEFSKATSTLGKALHFHPKDPFARQSLAEIYIMQREIKKAEIELLKNISSVRLTIE